MAQAKKPRKDPKRVAAAKKAAATRKRNAAAASKKKPNRNAAPAKRQRKGSSVEARAKKAGATGGRLTAAKTALRNALIVQRATVDRWPWPMIAEEAGVSEKQCRRVVEDAGSAPSPLDVTQSDLIEEWATGYRQSITTLTVLAANADNTAAAVGAIKAANDARDKLIALLQAIGHIDHDLGTLKVQRDVEQIARRMLDAVEGLIAGELTAEGVRDVFFELAGVPQVPDAPPELMPGEPDGG